MDVDAALRRNVRIFYAWIASTVLLGAGPIVGQTLINRGTLPTRIAGVVFAVGSALPWMWLVFVIVRRGDEFFRRLHLVALGFAFAGASLELLALSWLVNAEFIDYPNLLIVWISLMALWAIALLVAKRYYARER